MGDKRRDYVKRTTKRKDFLGRTVYETEWVRKTPWWAWLIVIAIGIYILRACY